MNDIRKYINLIESYERVDESFKDAQVKFEQSEDKEEVKLYIDKFKTLAKQNKIQGQDKDIGKWIKSGWDEFKAFVDSKSSVVSKRTKKSVSKKDVIELYNDNGIKAVIPLSKAASCFYGSNTKWCTAGRKDNLFNYYFKMRNVALIYVIYGNTKVAVAAPLNDLDSDMYEIFDEQDNSINHDGFMELLDSKVSPEELIQLVKPHKDKLLQHSISDATRKLITSLEEQKKIDDAILNEVSDEELRDFIVTDPMLAYHFIRFTESDRLRSEMEAGIAANATYSIRYATKVLKGRFEKGEDVISKDARESVNYADDVIKGRFKKGEPAIIAEPYFTIMYAKDVINGRFEEGEDTIMRGGAKYAFAYATKITKQRFEKAEQLMSSDLDDKSKQKYFEMFDVEL